MRAVGAPTVDELFALCLYFQRSHLQRAQWRTHSSCSRSHACGTVAIGDRLCKTCRHVGNPMATRGQVCFVCGQGSLDYRELTSKGHAVAYML
eukprot:2102349-Amphidinium_carterae.2